MKKIIYIALTVAAAFCFSCTKQDYYDVSLSNREIGFSTYSGRSVETKAESPDPFLVEAYYKGSKYFDAQTVTFSNSVWNLSTAYFWPATVDASNKMEFYAVRKKSSGDSHTFTGKVVTVGTALAADADIRTSYAAATAVPDGAQALNFTHDLAKMKFTLKAADPNLTYTVTAMKVTAKKTGTLTLNTDTRTWATTGSAADYSITGFTPSPNTTQGSVFGETNIIPQNNVVISVTYSVATPGGVTVLASTTKTKTVDLSANRGKSTQYNISLPSGASGTAEMSVSCNVTDWDSQTDVNQAWDAPKVSDITINKSKTSLVINGGITETLTATVTPAEALQTVTWSSSNTSIAKVSSAGVVSAVDVGKVTITATAIDGSAVYDCCDVMIVPPAHQIWWDKNGWFVWINQSSVESQTTTSDNNRYIYTSSSDIGSLPNEIWDVYDGQNATGNVFFYFPNDVTSCGYNLMDAGGETDYKINVITSEGEFSAYPGGGISITFHGGNTVTTTTYCYAKGTLITLSDGSRKPVESISYSDKLKVWNFDKGREDSAEILWISKEQKATRYYKCVLSDGTVLKLIGANHAHRLFNYTDKFFEGTADIEIGKEIFTENGIVTKVAGKWVEEEIEYYNIITNKDINCYANGVLTSCRFSNLYPISDDMRYIKDGRKVRPYRDFKKEGISREWYYGMRLGEQNYEMDYMIEYVNHCITVQQEKPELSFFEKIKLWFRTIFC